MANYNAQNYGKMVEGQMEQTQAIELKAIIIDWVEARREGDPDKETFVTVAAAEVALAAHAFDAPATGGYDKVDFKVVLTNDDCYEGRIDLQYQHRTGYSIRGHIVDFLTYILKDAQLKNLYNVSDETLQEGITLYNRVLA